MSKLAGSVQYKVQSTSLALLVEKAMAAYPGEEARILRGAEIVERGGVREYEGKPPQVGIYHYYPVTSVCPCIDATLKQAPEGRCKHRWALTLHHKLAQQPAMRSLVFYAQWEGLDGTATVWEDGNVDFLLHDSHEPIPTTLDQVVLGGKKSDVDAAQAYYDREIARMTGKA
jgi:hypothetical protein